MDESDKRTYLKWFSDNVKRERTRAKLSQETLAIRAGLHRTHTSLIESAKRDVQLTTIWAIANALNVAPGDLMKRPQRKRPVITVADDD